MESAEESIPEDLYTSDYEVGQDNLQGLGLDIHNPVFLISSVTIALFVLVTLLMPDQAAEHFSALRFYLSKELDWFFMYSMNGFLIFCVALALSPLGRIRIGGQDAVAQYHLLSWVSMLFAAGIGIGIMFYGVLEPMNHAITPPLGATDLDAQATRDLAMAATIYHWAFHPWAVYAVVGLSLSFFCYNKGSPATDSDRPCIRYLASASGAGRGTSSIFSRSSRPSLALQPPWVMAPNKPPAA